jgi:hypothetical protein
MSDIDYFLYGFAFGCLFVALIWVFNDMVNN